MTEKSDEGVEIGTVATPATDSGATPSPEAAPPAADESVKTPSADAPADAGAGDGETKAKAEERTLLDVVQDVLKPKAEVKDEGGKPEEKAPEAHGADDAAKKTGAEDDKASDADRDDYLTDDEMKGLPPRVRSRISTLTRKRKEAEEASEQYRGRAGQFDQVMSFLDTHGIAPEEMASRLATSAELRRVGVTPEEEQLGIDLVRLAKLDPIEGWKRAKPLFDAWARSVGEILPDELSREVEDGLISEDRAREIARLQTTQALEARRQQQADQQSRQQRERETASVQDRDTQEIARAVDVAEAELRATDPDYAAKAEEIYEQLTVMVTRNGKPPATPEEGATLMREAHRVISERYSVRKTRREEIVPTGGGSQAPRTPKPEAPAPKNLADVVDLALRRA